MYNTMFFML